MNSASWPTALRVTTLLGLSLLPSGLFAQHLPSVHHRARAAFERGISEVRVSHFDLASVAFEESYRLRASPVVLYNLAGAYARMGRYRQSIQTYDRYVIEGATLLSRDRVTAVAESISRLRHELGRLTLRIDPAAAEVEVDGRAETPEGGVLALDPGVHAVSLSAAGRVTLHREVTLTAGENSVLEARLDVVPAPPVAVLVQPPTLRPPTDPWTPRMIIPPPWHPPVVVVPAPGITSRWWFWTGLGVLAAGASVAGLAAAGAFTRDEPLLGGTFYDVAAIRWR